MTFSDLVIKNGWSESSQLNILENFVNEKKLKIQLTSYAEICANEENSECDNENTNSINYESLDEIIACQGWNFYSQILIYQNFIESINLEKELYLFSKKYH